MSSSRTIGTETVNEDNLKGYYMGDGATYFYTQGDEYLNIFPVWDWRKIPGVTAYEDVRPIPDIRKRKSNNRSSLVGGLSKGDYGIAAMQLLRDGLTAHKIWFCTNDFIICLGTGITSDSTLCVTTSIDQCLKKGDLQVLKEGTWHSIHGYEAFESQDLRFFQNQTGYIIQSNDVLLAESGEREGRWHDFMGMYRPKKEKGEVCSLHLRHGIQPQNAHYCYVVLPNSTPDEVLQFSCSQSFQVVRNDSTAQILQVPSAGEGYWMAIYTPQRITLNGQTYTFDVPGVYYIEEEEKLFHHFIR